jgi:hypothetical protein
LWMELVGDLAGNGGDLSEEDGGESGRFL